MSKLAFLEFATSTALTEGPSKLGIGWYGSYSVADSQVPTVTQSGQSVALVNTVCMFQRVGVTRQAYWNMYDSFAFWHSSVWSATLNNDPNQVALQSFWGLFTESGSAKAAWTTLGQAYGGALSCPAAANVTPNVEISVDAPYITISQPLPVHWVTSDSGSLSLNNAGLATSGSQSCDSGAFITTQSNR